MLLLLCFHSLLFVETNSASWVQNVLLFKNNYVFQNVSASALNWSAIMPLSHNRHTTAMCKQVNKQTNRILHTTAGSQHAVNYLIVQERGLLADYACSELLMCCDDGMIEGEERERACACLWWKCGLEKCWGWKDECLAEVWLNIKGCGTVRYRKWNVLFWPYILKLSYHIDPGHWIGLKEERPTQLFKAI